jgi:endonuclease/exonuclease/phosphatase family metal-dependent hydrolase
VTLRRPLSIALSTIALALAACGDDDAGGGGFVYSDDGKLKVMTRNLYLGADLTPVLVASTQESFLAATTGVWSAVSTDNDFRARARLLAAEIAAERPDLVGLQEVSLWRTQTPGDAALGGTTPATTVAFDFLSLLRRELSSRGLPYVVAKELDLFDIEAPVFVTSTSFMDVRLTDRQVILKISGLPTENPRGELFSSLLEVTVFGTTTPLSILRGWTAVDATVAGQKVAFYDTHLEAFSPLAREAQAAELRVVLDAEPLSTVVVVGDLNSDPDGASPGAYGTVLGADLTDLVVALGSTAPTCCFDPNLTVSTDDAFVERIDHVLFKGALNPIEVERVGEDPASRGGTPARWPSDHAGVVGTFDP